MGNAMTMDDKAERQARRTIKGLAYLPVYHRLRGED